MINLRLLIGLCLLMANSVSAQDADNRLVTTGEATLDVAADQVVLTINLSYSDDKDASLVYELHQLNQQKLAAILNELKVEGKDIAYGQLLTRKEREFIAVGGSQDRIKSFQQVTVTINDLNRFAAVQRRLVSDGFTDVVTNFRASNRQAIENQLLLKAIGRAREKADLMAKAIARTVKRVVRLGDADETEGASLRNLLVGGPSINQPRFTTPLSQTSQIIRLSSQVKLVVELE